MRYLISIILLLPVSFACCQNVQLTVIGNQKGAPASLKFDELKAVFMGEKQRWRDGTKVRLALLKTSTDVGKVIARKVYQMSSDEVRKSFVLGLFAFKTEPPETFETTGEVQDYVKKNPGAIGIIDQSPLTTADITVIAIDGKKTF